jgi:surface protein
MKKLLYLFLAITVACADDEGNPCVYSPTLTTSAVTNVTETSATLNGVISIVSQNCEDPTNTEQGFVYATTIQPTIANTQVNVNGAAVTTTLENLELNTTYYVRTFLTNAFGDFYGNEVSFLTTEEPVTCDDVVYLDANGVTIKACEDANVGDTGVINGVTYTVVDEAMLREMIANGEDVTKAATTKVTDMSYMFDSAISFNQPIGNWDVSNVTNMSYMFGDATSFNQPIGNWDVSSVISMYSMFNNSSFNQPIANWDVSNVTDMSRMFVDSPFNQPIGNWNVSNVTNMRRMFYGSSFNQPIGNWDVSNVTDMSYMFEETFVFNQDLSNWDVSNVTDMYYMFTYASSFNQPIANWDVSNVISMSSMFYGSSFNQPIANWDVSNVTNMDEMFESASSFNQPIGNWDVSNVTNMYEMFENASSFNQNLSTWNVENVSDCSNFSYDTPQWTQPKPNFTNCTP